MKYQVLTADKPEDVTLEAAQAALAEEYPDYKVEVHDDGQQFIAKLTKVAADDEEEEGEDGPPASGKKPPFLEEKDDKDEGDEPESKGGDDDGDDDGDSDDDGPKGDDLGGPDGGDVPPPPGGGPGGPGGPPVPPKGVGPTPGSPPGAALPPPPGPGKGIPAPNVNHGLDMRKGPPVGPSTFGSVQDKILNRPVANADGTRTTLTEAASQIAENPRYASYYVHEVKYDEENDQWVAHLKSNG